MDANYYKEKIPKQLLQCRNKKKEQQLLRLKVNKEIDF